MNEIAAPPSPYKGLAPFEDSARDALFFFGREREIEVIVANLMAARLTILFGPSGVGKTSLLGAGVAHRLRSTAGAVVAVVSSWAGDPIEAVLDAVDEAAGAERSRSSRRGTLADVLAASARRLDADLYVILDQFEEYFLYHEGEQGPGTLAEELPEALRRAGLRANFLLGIRDDSLAALDPLKPRIPNLFANSLRLDRLDRVAARSAILGPLERYNELVRAEEPVTAEPELVDELLHQVAVGRVDLGQAGRGGIDESDAERIEAPYLQLVLERLWEVERNRGSNQLRLSTLTELGGAARIVEDHLERAMAALSSDEKDAAAAIYNHLVTPSGTKIAHRARDLAGYADVDEGETQRVLHRLVEERIVRAGEDGAAGPRYEIFHDVLAEAVLAWRTRHEAERRLEEERQAAARRHRRLLALTTGALVVIAILAGIAIYALLQRKQASKEANHARAQQLVALAESESAVDPERSVSLALSAAEKERSSVVEDELRRALSDLRVKTVLPGGGPVALVAVDPKGRRVVVAGEAGARLFDMRSGALVRTVDTAAVHAAVFSPDGRFLATGGDGGAVHVWDVVRMALVRTLTVGSGATSTTFSRDGRLLAITTKAGRTEIWRVPSWRRLRVLKQPGATSSASFSGDGRLLVTAGDDRVARVFAISSGRLVHRLAQPSKVAVARFAPSGPLLATAAPDRIVRIWNGRNGKLLHALRGHTGQVVDVEFSPDGRRLVSASVDEDARVWDVRTGAVVSILLGNENFVVRAVFSPDGEHVATASADRTAKLYSAEDGALRATFAGHRDSLTGVAFGPHGNTLVTASADGTARLWTTRTRRDLDLLGGKGAVSSLAFAQGDRFIVSAHVGPAGVLTISDRRHRLPDRRLSIGSITTAAVSANGTLVASADPRGTIRIWAVDPALPARPELLRTIDGGRVASLSFSADGSELAGADGRRTATVWRVGDGSVLHTVKAPSGTIATASLSSDRSQLVTTGGLTAAIWDVGTGHLEHSLVGHTGQLTSAAFSPDGKLVVTTSRDRDARVWDAETGKMEWLLRGIADYAVVNGASFSADGRWVVTAGPGSAGLWNAQTGRLLFFVHAHEPLLNAAAFSHQGWRIATGGAIDGRVETFDCRLCGNIDDLIAVGRERLANLRR